MLHADNAYYIPARRRSTAASASRTCRSNTAFRGFGGPQAMAAIENIIEEIAQDAWARRARRAARNLYGDRRARTSRPTARPSTHNHLPEIVETLARVVATTRTRRRQRSKPANADAIRLRLRGIALSPVKFGISFTTRFSTRRTRWSTSTPTARSRSRPAAPRWARGSTRRFASCRRRRVRPRLRARAS